MNKLNLDKKIFIPTAIIMVAIIAYGAIAPESFAAVFTEIKNWMGATFTWIILLIAVVMTFTLAVVAFSKFGGKVIGGPDARPEYKTHTWIFMIICGNIGIAMMFYAVVEPITFFTSPPNFWGVAAASDAAAEFGVAQATFHWAAVTWVIDLFAGFAGVLLCIHYGLPFRPSTSLYPMLKEKAFGKFGTVYDVIALIGILAGLMTGFGFGITQFCTGLNFVLGIEITKVTYTVIVLIAVLVLFFSSSRGFAKGLALFSTANSWLYLFFLAFLLLVGPFTQLLELVVGGAGSLISNFIPMLFNGDFLGEDAGWNTSYTAWTWVWGFVYGPFSGLYLAKISKGRTIRQFLGVVVLVSTAFMLIWFSFWGGNAIVQTLSGIDIMGVIGEFGTPVANFVVLQNLPFSTVTFVLLFICIAIGYVTLVDALPNVIAGMCVTKVDENMETPVIVRNFWILVLALLTLISLFVLDIVGMTALQNLTVILGIPLGFCGLIIAAGMYQLISGKTHDHILSPEGQAGLAKAGIKIDRAKLSGYQDTGYKAAQAVKKAQIEALEEAEAAGEYAEAETAGE